MAGSIISKIKNSVQSAGENRGKIIKIAPDKKLRMRFLEEMDEGKEIVMHDSFERGISAVCRKHFGDSYCPFCDDPDVKTQYKYAWSVWDVDAKEVKIFLWQATSRSPVNQLLSYYETYSTVMDRDYVIDRKGSRLDTTYQVIPMDKSKFRNENAKPLSESALMKILEKAYPAKAFKDVNVDSDADTEDEPTPADTEDEPTPTKRKKTTDKAIQEEVTESLAEWLENKLEAEDIDEDDFVEYHDAKTLNSLAKGKTKKQLLKMVEEYISADEDDDDEE